MRNISVKYKQVKATSAYFERPQKPYTPKTDKFTEICLHCSKSECRKGFCEKTRGRK